MLNKNLITKIFFIVIILLFASSTGFSQETLKEKLKKIKGDVDKITITAGGEEFTFQGDEAEKLFKNMKSKTKHNNTFFVSKDGDENSKKIIIKMDDDSGIYEFNEGDDNDIVWFGDDDDLSGTSKRIKVEMNDGKKKVTVTTKENGEEKTKVYEGKEAEEYLEKNKSDDDAFDIEFKDGKFKKKIIIEKESKDSDDN